MELLYMIYQHKTITSLEEICYFSYTLVGCVIIHIGTQPGMMWRHGSELDLLSFSVKRFPTACSNIAYSSYSLWCPYLLLFNVRNQQGFFWDTNGGKSIIQTTQTISNLVQRLCMFLYYILQAARVLVEWLILEILFDKSRFMIMWINFNLGTVNKD